MHCKLSNAVSADVNAQALQVMVPAADAATVLSYVLRQSPLSLPQINEALHKGAIWWQAQGGRGKRRKPLRIYSFQSLGGAAGTVLINYNAAVLATQPRQPQLVSDQQNYSIWNKPSGVFSQPTRWSDHCSITRLVELAHAKPAYLVHRLDRAASGLMVIAHTRPALRKLASLFEHRQIGKHYRATVCGRVAQPLPWVIQTPVDGKPAHTEIVDVSYSQSQQTSRLIIAIHSGRKHQIRVHLAGAGHPIVGDRLYNPQHVERPDLQLCAFRLTFVCPFSAAKLSFELDESASKPLASDYTG